MPLPSSPPFPRQLHAAGECDEPEFGRLVQLWHGRPQRRQSIRRGVCERPAPAGQHEAEDRGAGTFGRAPLRYIAYPSGFQWMC